jgi:hypothetical protein
MRKSKFILDIASIENGNAVPAQEFVIDRTTSYGYGEISLPVISPSNSVPLVNRLSFTAAVRYENVSHVGDVATPKLGAIYAPTRDIAFKFSWGKSFKAPTQYQSGRPRSGYSQIGATAYFPESRLGNRALCLGRQSRPQAGACHELDRHSLTDTVFHRRAAHRRQLLSHQLPRAGCIPIPQNSLAFSPVYAAYVTLNPSRDQVLAALSGITTLYDQGGGNPATANVVAIVTNYLQNAAIQKIDGVDLAIDYSFPTGSQDRINLYGAASYLESEQQLSTNQPMVQLAGILYRPPLAGFNVGRMATFQSFGIRRVLLHWQFSRQSP